MSLRGLQTLLVYAKAMAYFRAQPAVSVEDVRQVLPFVLHDKLVPEVDAPYFEANAALRTDRIGWLRRLFDLSCADYDRLDLDHDDPVAEMLAELGRGLRDVPEGEIRQRREKIERLLAKWSTGRKLYGTVAEDILVLKYLHQRYTNYLAWLRWKG
jgi:hypothetical protein